MKTLFTSRKFWVAFITLIAVIIGVFIPGFALNIEEAAGLVIIAVAYLVGVAVDPGPGDWRGVIQSRKFWAAAIGFVLVWFEAFHVVLPFDLAPDQLISIAVVIGGYIAGVAFEQPAKTLPAVKSAAKK
ncbi:MAG: hypothetical protein IT308_09425 [Anaerolineaceae bacterium]|nr:hypothetical protein [Anaerolineaceae bacterium]